MVACKLTYWSVPIWAFLVPFKMESGMFPVMTSVAQVERDNFSPAHVMASAVEMSKCEIGMEGKSGGKERRDADSSEAAA